MTELSISYIKDQIRELGAADTGTRDTRDTFVRDGVTVYLTVTEMRDRKDHHRFDSKPSGRFQVSIPSPYAGSRQVITRSTKEGKIDWDKILTAIDTYIKHKKVEYARSNQKETNKAIAERVAKDFGLTTWSSNSRAVIATSVEDSPITIKWTIGALSEEKARKVLEILTSLDDIKGE